MIATGLKLNLGAFDRTFEGFRSVDIVPPADEIADLTKPWPWPDSSVEEILAFDVIEHLPDKRLTLNEMWRVLVPGGIARIGVPDSSEGDGADCDITHASRWNRSSFEYVQRGNYARERFRGSEYYGVRADFNVLSMERVRHERSWGAFVWEIKVVLEAVK